jgi:hypothetical protein
MTERAGEAADDEARPSQTERGPVIGAVAAGLVFVGLLCDGHLSLLRRDSVGGFFDLQAHSLLHGHLSVPAEGLGLEAFFVHGHAYMYYGPWPALLRMPVAAFTHRFDGRLSQLSMLVAFAVAMVFTIRLTRRIRPLVRGDAPMTRIEQWATGAFVFVVGGGSVLTFLASVGWVYHEAELWGAALAIAAFDLIVAFTITSARRELVLASLLTTLAFLSRGSVGAGPVAALGLLFAASLWRPARTVFGLSPRTAGKGRAGGPAGLAVAFAVPVVAYAAVNYAKFRTLFSLPASRQILYTPISASRRAALAANGNSLFGVKLVPTTVVHYLRPDGIRFQQLFPFVTFPPPAHVIGNARFDTIDASASLTATMPALTVLAIIGLVCVARARRPAPQAPGLAVLRAPVLGAAAALPVTLAIAFIAERYLSDFVPLLLLLAVPGLHVALAWIARPSTGRAIRRVVIVGLATLGVLSVWANVGLAILYQRTLAPTEVNDWRIADFVRFQQSIHSHIPGGAMPYVRRGEVLPRPGPLGTIFVLGDCRAVYWSGGDSWRAIERTRSTGYWRVQTTFAAAPRDQWQPVFVNGTPGAGSYLAVRVLPHARVVFGYISDGTGRPWLQSPPVHIRPSTASVLDLVYDPSRGQLAVRVDGRLVVDAPLLLRPIENPTIGRSDIGGPVAAAFAGTISELPTSPTLCRSLTR